MHMEKLRDLPTGLLVVLGALVIVQVSLQVWGLLDLSGRRKWVWALVILLGNLVGAIAYLVIGRNAPLPATSDELPSGDRAGNRRAAVDRLYGKRDA
jgi:membrane protein YqaA with SNARE-associated domain